MAGLAYWGLKAVHTQCFLYSCVVRSAFERVSMSVLQSGYWLGSVLFFISALIPIAFWLCVVHISFFSQRTCFDKQGQGYSLAPENFFCFNLSISFFCFLCFFLSWECCKNFWKIWNHSLIAHKWEDKHVCDKVGPWRLAGKQINIIFKIQVL